MNSLSLTNAEIAVIYANEREFEYLRIKMDKPALIDDAVNTYCINGWTVIDVNGDSFTVIRPWKHKFDPAVRINDQVLNAT